jgi:hypothetical protein
MTYAVIGFEVCVCQEHLETELSKADLNRNLFAREVGQWIAANAAGETDFFHDFEIFVAEETGDDVNEAITSCVEEYIRNHSK